MRIAFLMASYDTMHFFKVMADHLIDKGHTVKAFPAMPTKITGGKYSVEQCNWHTFEMSAIEKFNPDRILVWNGYHQPFCAAVSYLKEKYKLFHVELAWLPQKGQVYIDTHGIGSKSSIAGISLVGTTGKATQKERDIFNKLKRDYSPKGKPSYLPEKYVLVPLQLEMDTSIIFDSPFFKTMDSLIGYALKMSPLPVVIKPHPKDMIDKKSLERFKSLEGVDLKNVTIIDDKEMDINTLSAHSSGLIGINSTSMIEAALHFKPMVQLGMNVFNPAYFCMWDSKEAVHSVLNVQKDLLEDVYIRKIAFLAENQVSTLNPQPWALEKIINYVQGPRRIE
jgi:hypothetical protein